MSIHQPIYAVDTAWKLCFPKEGTLLPVPSTIPTVTLSQQPTEQTMWRHSPGQRSLASTTGAHVINIDREEGAVRAEAAGKCCPYHTNPGRLHNSLTNRSEYANAITAQLQQPALHAARSVDDSVYPAIIIITLEVIEHQSVMTFTHT